MRPSRLSSRLIPILMAAFTAAADRLLNGTIANVVVGPWTELQSRLKEAGPESILAQVDLDRLTEILAGKAAPPAEG